MAQRPRAGKRLCVLLMAASYVACLLISGQLVRVAQGQYADEGEQQQQQQQQQVVSTRVRRQQGGRIQVPINQVGALDDGPASAQAVSLASAQSGAPNPPSNRLPKISGSNNNARPNLQQPSSVSGMPLAPPGGSIESQQPPLEDPSGQLGPPMRPDVPRRQKKRRKQRVRPSKPPVYDDDADDDADEQAEGDQYEPETRRPRRPKTASSEYDDDDDDDEHCDDDDDEEDYGHGHLFKPVRQMTRMMDGVFDQMQSLASGGFRSFPTGGAGAGNMAMASSLSDSDGYSRTSSLVNNNGRQRGFVSETRNGRTKTRRIGNRDDEDEQ